MMSDNGNVRPHWLQVLLAVISAAQVVMLAYLGLRTEQLRYEQAAIVVVARETASTLVAVKEQTNHLQDLMVEKAEAAAHAAGMVDGAATQRDADEKKGDAAAAAHADGVAEQKAKEDAVQP